MLGSVPAARVSKRVVRKGFSSSDSCRNDASRVSRELLESPGSIRNESDHRDRYLAQIGSEPYLFFAEKMAETSCPQGVYQQLTRAVPAGVLGV